MRGTTVVWLLACGLAASGLAVGQTTPPPPAGGTADGVPFDVPIGAPVSLDMAKKIVAAVEAEAAKHHWKMAITVVDTHGELVHFSRMEGTQIGSGNVSQAKARTAARF